MPDILERGRNLRNGKDETHLYGRGLGNTDPVATLGSTFGPDLPLMVLGSKGSGKSALMLEVLERSDDPVFVVQSEGRADFYVRSPEGVLIVETKVPGKGKTPKAAGQVVLFKKIMEDWGFGEQEAATLLGFEAALDIREIYHGIKSIGHRDANDRLRAVLRIATDLDALFEEVPAIRDWLKEPQRDLGGTTPRSLLNEGSMENLLRVKYYVSYLSGR